MTIHCKQRLGLSMYLRFIFSLITFFTALTVLAFNSISDVHACSCFGSRSKYEFVSPRSLPSNAKGIVVDFHLVYIDKLWDRENEVILNFLTRKRRTSDFVAKDLSTNKRIRTRLVKLNAKELTPHYFKKRYYLFTKKVYKHCLEDHQYKVKSKLKKCKKIRDIFAKHPNNWVSILRKKRILKEVTKKVQRTYGLYRIEPLRKFAKERNYQFSVKGENNSFKVKIDSDPMLLKHIEDIQMKFDQPIQYTYMMNPGAGECSNFTPTVVKPIGYQLHKDLKPFSKYMVMALMIRDHSESSKLSSENFFTPWTHHSSLCGSYSSYNLGAFKDSFSIDCTRRKSFIKGKMEIDSLSVEVKAVFGIPEIEDRLYETQPQALVVDQKQFEGCLATPPPSQLTVDQKLRILRPTLRDQSEQKEKKSSCEHTFDCKKYGLCSMVDGVCKATRDKDCAESSRCKTHGLCSVIDGECKAVRDKDCAESSECKTDGLCSAVDGECKATKNKDCAESSWCKKYGDCSPIDGTCRATKTEDCTQSQMCLKSGHCSAVNGSCIVARDADCTESMVCKRLGRCSKLGKKCSVTKDEDCAKSRRCQKYGYCLAVDEKCVKP